MSYTKGKWIAGFNPHVTGPTTPTVQPFCGGDDWPYRTINVGEETIAIIPAQAKEKIIGRHSAPLEESAEANAHLISAAPDMYEALLAITEHFKTIEKLYSKDRIVIAQAESAMAKAEGK